jgi:hypothetical protein
MTIGELKEQFDKLRIKEGWFLSDIFSALMASYEKTDVYKEPVFEAMAKYLHNETMQ